VDNVPKDMLIKCPREDLFHKISCAGGDISLDEVTLHNSSPFYALLPAPRRDAIDAGQNAVVLAIGELADATVGEAIGKRVNPTVTLSPTAAGYGWFIDLTPSDNTEFLPTSNPLEWIARPGSEAEGRMDLLTVLLHEYGHVAGLGHTVDSHDLMASTLLPGIRRLPSSVELTALRGLTFSADAAPVPYDPNTPPGAPLPLSRSLGSLRAGRLRPSDTTALKTGNSSATIQFDTVANPALANPAFTGGVGWSVTGDVYFDQGTATLRESAATQTRLNQAFVVGANDLMLSFTLSDIALDDVNGSPDDAFEVALIDASTGLSLLGGIGLADSDAILNLQADGSEHLAGGVAMRRNADGSRSVRVDLSAVAAGTVANLSFDLIGFGRGAAATSSQITISQLQLAGLLREARDDEATTAEDTPVILAVMGNDPGADHTGVWPLLVDLPTHGDVTPNADGSFTYYPLPDWHGDDRFTYRLSNDGSDSNVAVVTLSVTPVNDAPTIVERRVTLDEDSLITLDLRFSASDVDGDALSFTVGDPQHGTLVRNADGTLIYRPDADFHGDDRFVWTVSDGQLNAASVLSITINAVNDVPVANDDAATLPEDGRIALDLLGNDYDIDGDTLDLIVDTSPAHGTLTRAADQRLIYAPHANWSGEDSFTYVLDDGQGRSAVATVRLIVTPLADAPTLTIIDGAGTTRNVFRTGWESVENADDRSTVIRQGQLESWQIVSQSDAGATNVGGFEVWSTGDRLLDRANRFQTLTAATGGGENWLELNFSAGDSLHPTQAIERRVETLAGATYTLSLAVAGEPDYNADYAPVAISVDGQQIGSAGRNSSSKGLAWQTSSFQFIGGGGTQTIRIAAEAARYHTRGLGVMIDEIELSETLPPNTGVEDNAIRLPTIRAALIDTDGSEALDILIEGVPASAMLSDGGHRLAAGSHGTVSVIDWDLDQMWFTPPPAWHGHVTLTVVATATERADQARAGTSTDLTLSVLPANDARPAGDTRLTWPEDGKVAIERAALTRDVDGDAPAPSLGDPAHGTLARNADGISSHAPQAHNGGADSFSFFPPANATDPQAGEPNHARVARPRAAGLVAAGLLSWNVRLPGGQTFRPDVGNRNQQPIGPRVTAGAGFPDGNAGKDIAIPSPACAAVGPRRSNDARHRAHERERHHMPAVEIAWGGAKPACFKGAVIEQSAWLAEFLGVHRRENRPIDLPSWQITIR